MTALLGPAEIRDLATRLGVRPTKSLGQNFVHDPNTVRRIVASAGLDPTDTVIEALKLSLGSAETMTFPRESRSSRAASMAVWVA